MNKHLFLESILNASSVVTNDLIDEWVTRRNDPEKVLLPSDFDDTFRSIFDMNKDDPFGDAEDSILGYFNRRSNAKRIKIYRSAIKGNHTIKQIYVEGDSWYQHPLIKEIYDYVWQGLKHKNYAMYPSALGGDWILRIITEGKYIAELSNISSDVILLAGGGNDLVGRQKLSNLIHVGRGHLLPDFQNVGESALIAAINDHPLLGLWMQLKEDDLNSKQRQDLLYSLTIFNKEFYAVMLLLQTIYKYLIHGIRQKFGSQKIIFHGYDYPIPSYRKGRGLNLKKLAVNLVTSNGHWLALALDQARVPVERQSAVTFSMIFILNEMIINTVIHNEKFNDNVFFIDARGAAGHQEKNWYDEMHVKPVIFKKIAARFIECIESEQSEQRVFRV